MSTRSRCPAAACSVSGIRCVSGAWRSPIRSLKDFDKVITLAATADEWSEALVAALAPSAVAGDAVTARQQVARQYDWSELTYDIARTICDRLGPDYAARARKLPVETPVLAS